MDAVPETQRQTHAIPNAELASALAETKGKTAAETEKKQEAEPVATSAATDTPAKAVHRRAPAHDPTPLVRRAGKLQKTAKLLGEPSLIQKAMETKASSDRLVAARVPLTAAERVVSAARATVAPLSQALDQRISTVAKHLRLSPAGKQLLARAGKRTPWNRATLMMAELRLGGLELPASAMSDLEGAYQALSAPQAVLEQSLAAQRDAAAAYMVEATRLRNQLTALWGNLVAARSCPPVG
jgi:hypothetical protein